jgi:hypothetical protein
MQNIKEHDSLTEIMYRPYGTYCFSYHPFYQYFAPTGQSHSGLNMGRKVDTNER